MRKKMIVGTAVLMVVPALTATGSITVGRTAAVLL